MINADLLTDIGKRLIEILIILLVTAGVLIAARLLMRHWLWPVLRKTRTPPDRRILSLIERFVYISLIVFGLRQVARVIAPGFPGVDDLFFILYWILATYFIIRLISVVADWYLKKIAPRLEGTTHEKIVPVVKYVIYIIVFALALIILMDYFGITSSVLTAGIAALGVGTLVVGLAAENIINDLISGIVISIDRPFRVGDRIEILDLDTWGDVQEIGWRSTRILTRDKRMVDIPNSLIGSNMVTNYSVPNKVFRVETDVVVAYGADIEYVRGMIREAMEVQDWVMKEKPIQVLLLEFQGAGVMFKARCWIEDYVDTRLSVDQLNTAIYTRLFETGIIAGPASDIIVHRAKEPDAGKEE
jgi:MscS family membrane protein